MSVRDPSGARVERRGGEGHDCFGGRDFLTTREVTINTGRMKAVDGKHAMTR